MPCSKTMAIKILEAGNIFYSLGILMLKCCVVDLYRSIPVIQPKKE